MSIQMIIHSKTARVGIITLLCLIFFYSVHPSLKFSYLCTSFLFASLDHHHSYARVHTNTLSHTHTQGVWQQGGPCLSCSLLNKCLAFSRSLINIWWNINERKGGDLPIVNHTKKRQTLEWDTNTQQEGMGIKRMGMKRDSFLWWDLRALAWILKPWIIWLKPPVLDWGKSGTVTCRPAGRRQLASDASSRPAAWLRGSRCTKQWGCYLEALEDGPGLVSSSYSSNLLL